MAAQTKVKKSPKKKETKQPEEEVAVSEKAAESTVEEIDAWLDEIDDVLEQNDAAEFVKNYVQKGGE